MKVEVHTTKDGSSTLYSRQFGQFYHNPNGAVSESLHVFFDASDIKSLILSNSPLNILEIGFGTGLNFLLLADLCLQLNISKSINFYSVEAFPVNTETAQKFNFRKHLRFPKLNDELPRFFSELHSGLNFNHFKELPNLKLRLFFGEFDEFNTESLQADVIFHDPFSPEVNEELWTNEVFSKIKSLSNPSARLVTYCASSKARGAMAAAGWLTAKAKGALGKREMTIAALKAENLSGLKMLNNERLAARYIAGDFK